MSVLRLEDVSVCRAERILLEQISLKVMAGETVGVVGVSGAGKSTLLRVALGLERPTRGCVRWGEVDPWRASARQVRAARRHIGAVFQQPASSLDPRLTLGECVAEPLWTHERRLSARAVRDRVEVALGRVGLPVSFATRLPRSVSGGEAQRVAIARALITEPALVVMDEPTSALDASSAAELLNVLADLRGEGRAAFLMVSHDLAALGAVAERLVVLERGHLVEEGPTARCFQAPTSTALAELVALAGG